MIVGGFDRGLDWQAFADYVHAHPPLAVIVNGANGRRIAAQLACAAGRLSTAFRLPTSLEAVAIARDETPGGGVVLLSPGAPSFDQFHDYAERGRSFAELAGFDAEAIGQIEGLGIA